jgi:signal transduction histidine kinase
MEKIIRVLMMVITCLMWSVGLAGILSAADRGTEAQAKALVAKAIAAYEANGKAAFSKMTAPSTEFTEGDLYIFVIGPDHKTVAHGADATQIGKDVLTLRDASGKHFGKALFDKATPKGAWVNYVYKDPVTGKVEPKKSWVVRHDSYVFGCGVYKPSA